MTTGSSTSNRKVNGEGGSSAAIVIPSGTSSHAKYSGSPLAIRPQYKWPTPADKNDSAKATQGTRRDVMTLAIITSKQFQNHRTEPDASACRLISSAAGR